MEKIKNVLMGMNKKILVKLLLRFYYLDCSSVTGMLDHYKFAHAEVSREMFKMQGMNDTEAKLLIEDLHKIT